MTTQIEPVSETALDCFIHGLAHLIDEHGPQQGVVTAANLLGLVSEEFDESPMTPIASVSRVGR